MCAVGITVTALEMTVVHAPARLNALARNMRIGTTVTSVEMANCACTCQSNDTQMLNIPDKFNGRQRALNDG